MLNSPHVWRPVSMNNGQFTLESYNGAVSWPWMAEIIRTTCCQLYALGGIDDCQRPPRHSNEILSEVRRRLGHVDGFSPEKDILRTIFLLLLRLGDFAHVQRSAYIPRETRILLFSPNYARVAGGLPLPFSEYKDEGVVLCETETIGRIVEVANEQEDIPIEWSFSRCFIWGRMSIAERVEMQFSRVRRQTPAITENVAFYNPKKVRAYHRGERWQGSAPKLEYTIARGAGIPHDYFLVLDCGSKTEQWFETSYEDARCWWVIIDQIAGTAHSVRRQTENSIIRFTLPMNMPDFCIEAMASASSHLHREKHLWHFSVPECFAPLVDYVCSITALHQYE